MAPLSILPLSLVQMARSALPSSIGWSSLGSSRMSYVSSASAMAIMSPRAWRKA